MKEPKKDCPHCNGKGTTVAEGPYVNYRETCSCCFNCTKCKDTGTIKLLFSAVQKCNCCKFPEALGDNPQNPDLK
jgi:hypothetical protein